MAAVVLGMSGLAVQPALAQQGGVISPPAAQAVAPKLLGIGDAAPKLEVGEWIRGEGVKEFAKGRVYVVEFGATWCPPCKASIPHLTELQGKHKDKLTVVGVHVWEGRGGETQDALVKKVKTYVETFEPAIGYTVAMDTASQTMASGWLGAAGLNSIPHAFIVMPAESGTGGQIAWIGNPLSPQFDEMIQKAVDGNLDVKVEAKRAADEAAMMERYGATMRAAQKLEGEGKVPEAIAVIETHLKTETEKNVRGALARYKFNLLATTDEPAAYAMVKGLAEGEMKDSEEVLSLFCDTIASADNLKTPDYKLAVKLGEQANQISEGKKAEVLHRLAGAYFKDGQVEKAISTQEAAIMRFKEQVGEAKAGPMVGIMRQRIEEWRKSAGK